MLARVFVAVATPAHQDAATYWKLSRDETINSPPPYQKRGCNAFFVSGRPSGGGRKGAKFTVRDLLTYRHTMQKLFPTIYSGGLTFGGSDSAVHNRCETSALESSISVLIAAN